MQYANVKKVYQMLFYDYEMHDVSLRQQMLKNRKSKIFGPHELLLIIGSGRNGI
jgi:hypothetical protein